jgi:integrase
VGERREPCSLVFRRQQAVSARTTRKDETAAAGRRRRAFGTVEHLPSGNFRARVLGPHGKYVSAPMTFATKADATVWVDLQRADQVRGLWQAQAPVRRVEVRTVGEYLQQWITQHPSARPGTKELYVGLLRTCIVDDLGLVALADLTAEMVRGWHFDMGERLAADADRRRTALLAKGRQASSASVSDGRTRQAQAYRLLRAAMATAVTDGVIDAQPCRIRGAGTPKAVLGRVPDLADRLLSPVQVAAVADAMPPRYRALVLAAAWSGLRQGELMALTRSDLDLDASPATVRVRRSVRRSESGTVRTDLPKTPASTRTVSLPAPLAHALAGHLAEFVSEEPDAPLFRTATGTLPARSNLSTTFGRALVAAGAPQVRFHDLRHVAQVYAAEAGATLPELMARLGHSTPAAALVYLHARSDRDHALTEALSAAMTR